MKSIPVHRKLTLVEIVIIVALIGLLIAMATPKFGLVNTTSQDKAVVKNLGLFSRVAQQYLLDEGVTVVTFDQIVSPGKSISTIQQIADKT